MKSGVDVVDISTGKPIDLVEVPTRFLRSQLTGHNDKFLDALTEKIMSNLDSKIASKLKVEMLMTLIAVLRKLP